MLRVTVTASGYSAPQSYFVATDPATYVPSAYEGIDNFVIDIMFEGKYEVITEGAIDPGTGLPGPSTISYVYQNAVNVTSAYDWAARGIEYSKPNAYTVRLTGPAETVFDSQFYEFKMADKTIQRLPANTTLPFMSLIEYRMPSPTFTMLAYPFSVTIPATYGSPSTTVESHTMNQWFHWNYSVASSNIASIRSRGLK